MRLTGRSAKEFEQIIRRRHARIMEGRARSGPESSRSWPTVPGALFDDGNSRTARSDRAGGTGRARPSTRAGGADLVAARAPRELAITLWAKDLARPETRHALQPTLSAYRQGDELAEGRCRPPPRPGVRRADRGAGAGLAAAPGRGGRDHAPAAGGARGPRAVRPRTHGPVPARPSTGPAQPVGGQGPGGAPGPLRAAGRASTTTRRARSVWSSSSCGATPPPGWSSRICSRSPLSGS